MRALLRSDLNCLHCNVSHGSVVANGGDALFQRHPPPASRPISDSSRRGACRGAATVSRSLGEPWPVFRVSRRNRCFDGDDLAGLGTRMGGGRRSVLCRRNSRRDANTDGSRPRLAQSAGRVQGAVTLGSGGGRLVASLSIAADTMEPETGVREQSTTRVSRARIPSSAPPSNLP